MYVLVGEISVFCVDKEKSLPAVKVNFLKIKKYFLLINNKCKAPYLCIFFLLVFCIQIYNFLIMYPAFLSQLRMIIGLNRTVFHSTIYIHLSEPFSRNNLVKISSCTTFHVTLVALLPPCWDRMLTRHGYVFISNWFCFMDPGMGPDLIDGDTRSDPVGLFQSHLWRRFLKLSSVSEPYVFQNSPLMSRRVVWDLIYDTCLLISRLLFPKHFAVASIKR